MVSQLTQMPTENAPSKKRAPAIAPYPGRRGKTPTTSAYPISDVASVVLAENRRRSAPIGSDATTMPDAKTAASWPISAFEKPRASRKRAVTAIETPYAVPSSRVAR